MSPVEPGHLPPVEQKHPNDRAHWWDHANANRDGAPAAPVSTDYPRHVHKPAGEFMTVSDDAAFQVALTQGWSSTPYPPVEPTE